MAAARAIRGRGVDALNDCPGAVCGGAAQRGDMVRCYQPWLKITNWSAGGGPLAQPQRSDLRPCSPQICPSEPANPEQQQAPEPQGVAQAAGTPATGVSTDGGQAGVLGPTRLTAY